MNKLESFIQKTPAGFLRDINMPELVAIDRLCPVLVRCGGCRFTCAAQYVPHLEKCITAGGDYVRDVSFPVGAMERAASWKPECVVTPVSQLPESFVANRPTGQPVSTAHGSTKTIAAECSTATRLRATPILDFNPLTRAVLRGGPGQAVNNQQSKRRTI